MNIDFVIDDKIKFHSIENNPDSSCDDYLVILQNVETGAYEIGTARWVGFAVGGRNWTITSRHIPFDEKKKWGWKIVSWAARPKVKPIQKVEKPKVKPIQKSKANYELEGKML